MGLDVFYKVRAHRERTGEVVVSEKGLLRYLRSSASRERLRNFAKSKLEGSSSEDMIYATYVWDLMDGTQMACFDRRTGESIGLSPGFAKCPID